MGTHVLLLRQISEEDWSYNYRSGIIMEKLLITPRIIIYTTLAEAI